LPNWQAGVIEATAGAVLLLTLFAIIVKALLRLLMQTFDCVMEQLGLGQ
jgi:hypothetical protein